MPTHLPIFRTRRGGPPLAAALVLWIAWAGVAWGAAGHGGERISAALLPIQNRAGEAALVQVLELALRERLDGSLRLIEADRARDSLRRLRIRNANDAPPGRLREALDSMGAQAMVSVTLHDAIRHGCPRVTLSARAYVEGELRWVGFRAASGLDRRTLLGMGVETDLEALTLAAADRLMAELEKALASPGGGGTLGRAGATEGRWALLPFTGLTSRSATANAETVTEAARAAALEQGISLLSPNRVSELLRQQRVVRWDQLTEDVRTSLLADGGAEVILTGSVEIYEAGGGPEPEPEVSVAMSLVDTATGNTLWSGALERRARDLERPFGLGRIFSHGALAQRLVTRLTNRLLREHGEAGRRGRLG